MTPPPDRNPGPNDSDTRSDYSELQDVTAVMDVPAMTAVSVVTAVPAVTPVRAVRAVRAAPRSDPAQPGRDLLAPHPGPTGLHPYSHFCDENYILPRICSRSCT